MSNPFGSDELDFDAEGMLRASYENAASLLAEERPIMQARFPTELQNPLLGPTYRHRTALQASRAAESPNSKGTAGTAREHVGPKATELCEARARPCRPWRCEAAIRTPWRSGPWDSAGAADGEAIGAWHSAQGLEADSYQPLRYMRSWEGPQMAHLVRRGSATHTRHQYVQDLAPRRSRQTALGVPHDKVHDVLKCRLALGQRASLHN